MKKEVSDHLAKAFFDKRDTKKEDKSFIFYIAVSLLFVAVLLFVSGFLTKPNLKGYYIRDEKLVFEKHDGPYILNFNFRDSSSKIETLAINIPDIDLSNYKRLSFSIRLKDADTRQLGSVKVGLVNIRKETSSLYVSDINNSWKKLSLPFSDFGKIQDWTRPIKITFTLEEWNIFAKKGELLIDGVEFSKN
ncbi:MAG: hypothetical protein AUJ74_02590 [Candidatus Omnitrophica bacterium CG1_02_44_16]|nr:MAG: hypothetical protein AUJ74_02590 [Candidatus Omnitrophica bacterium CG1_02_44_16]PIY82994.1 MAG: hypothetical protein COY78_03380 [Candidatus Omnitrophica bacterium CG_4_10_14_0_8_um_filter_44_12]